METHRQQLLTILEKLSEDEFKNLKRHLRESSTLSWMSSISVVELDEADEGGMVELIMKIPPSDTDGDWEKTKEILEKIGRKDLVEDLENAPDKHYTLRRCCLL